jgi:hypothetical protein
VRYFINHGVKVTLNEEDGLWRCGVLPLLASVYNAISEPIYARTGPEDGDPKAIVFNRIVLMVSPEKVVNKPPKSKKVEGLVY